MTGVLTGIRVVEMSYGIAAPLACRYLAALGADVVKVESVRRPDMLRQAPAPWLAADVPREARSDFNGIFGTMNASKRSAAIEVDRPDGREAFLRLVREADVFVTNIVPDSLDKLRVDYASLRAANPRLLYLLISTFGEQDAAGYRSYRTWGSNVTAFCGLSELTGFPDDPPMVWSFAYTDYVGALYGVASILAALEQRERTGGGERLDLALHEVVAAALGDLFERALNAEPTPARHGNTDPACLFQDVLQLRGADRWLALTLRNAADLEKLRAAVPHLPAGGEAFPAAIASWCRGMDEDTLRTSLAEVVVPWEIVANAADVSRDQRLRDGFWQLLPHRRADFDIVAALPLLQNGQRLRDRSAAPALGQHTAEVLAELGFDSDAIADLVRSGATATMAFPDLTVRRPWLDAPLPMAIDTVPGR